MMKTYKIEAEESYSIEIDHYPPAGVGRGVICYYHGGGLLFGTRSDLPKAYIDRLCQAGYHLLCFDYLLAPEANLEQIQESVKAGLRWFYGEGRALLGVEQLPYFLFGRSAGAYLALCAACRHTDPQDAPAAVLSFYGYTGFTHPSFSMPNFHYRKLPLVDEQAAMGYKKPGFISNAPKEQRFSLYLWARQTGKWVSLITGNDPAMAEKWSLSAEELQGLPPLFLTASTADQDVPFLFSRNLASQIPKAVFRPVFYLEHDFDRNPECEESKSIYRDCLAFLDDVLQSTKCDTPTSVQERAENPTAFAGRKA